jgi:hypothetical protein
MINVHESDRPSFDSFPINKSAGVFGMPILIRFAITMLFVLVIFCGCSNGNGTPVSPDNSGAMLSGISSGMPSDTGLLPIEEIALSGDTFSSSGLLGVFGLTINAGDSTAELISPRNSDAIGSSYLVSGLSFFTMAPCSDCLKIDSISPTVNGIMVTFSISHPFEKGNLSLPPKANNRRDLDVFDVAMVIAPSTGNDLETFPYLGAGTFSIYNGICTKTDGYTKEISAVAKSTNLCPYFLVIDNSDSGTSAYNKFEMGSKNVLFDTYFTQGGNFTLYLTMGYGAAATKSTFLTPTYYLPEFNRKSAWKVEAIPPEGNDPPSLTNTWQSSDTTTPHSVTVKVWDWQQNAIVAPTYPDPAHTNYIAKASKVSVVSAEVLGMTSYINSVTASTSGSGTPSDPLIFEIPIVNANGLSNGHYPGLVRVLDQRLPGLAGSPDSLMHTPDGIAQDWYTISEFATYQTFTATVGECPIPAAPADLSATDGTFPTKIVLTWTASVAADYYNIYRNNVLRATGVTGIVWIDTPVTSGLTYQYQIAGVSTACGEGPRSAQEQGSTCLAPSTPGAFAASDGTNAYVALSWTASSGATSYNIYRNSAAIQTGYTGTTYNDNTAAIGILYTYEVEAVNTCGASSRASDTGYTSGACPPEGNELCVTATEKYRVHTGITGCADAGIDSDWYYFYVSPLGFTSASTINVVSTSGSPLNIEIRGFDPAQSCPGTQIHSVTNVSSGIVNIPSSTYSKIFVKLTGYSGVCNYSVNFNFIPAISNVDVEVYVARNGSDVWPAGWSTTVVTNQITWANQLWDDYGYRLAWDGTVEYMLTDYFNLETEAELAAMHNAYGGYSNNNKLSLYIVNSFPPGWGNTAFCITYPNINQQTQHNVFSVYGPIVASWQDVVAHENGHAFGYLFDEYLYTEASCPCGDNDCLGEIPYLFWIGTPGCQSPNLMWYSTGAPIGSYNLQSGQYDQTYKFHFDHPTNFVWD